MPTHEKKDWPGRSTTLGALSSVGVWLALCLIAVALGYRSGIAFCLHFSLPFALGGAAVGWYAGRGRVEARDIVVRSTALVASILVTLPITGAPFAFLVFTGALAGDGPWATRETGRIIGAFLTLVFDGAELRARPWQLVLMLLCAYTGVILANGAVGVWVVWRVCIRGRRSGGTAHDSSRRSDATS